MLECSHLEKKYHNVSVVNDLSFTIRRGEVFALLGSNGAGKTTTIKMILELIPKDGGTIEKQGIKTIGYSPETPYFHPFLTGSEVLEYYGGLQKIPKRELKELVPRLLERTGLEKSKTKIRNYSKGMLQRLALAQALLGDPDLLILDEPTAGLDAVGRLEIIHTIQQLKKAGKTILLNSHILHDIERVCDRGIIIKKGKLVCDWESGRDTRSLEEIFIEETGGNRNWES